jgi:hypothetical protein
MTKIYSFVEVGGKTLIAPPAKPPRFESVVYLTQLDGRHYVATREELPAQPPEIELQGPIDLAAAENRPLAELLDQRAEPLRWVRAERARAYPPIGDQLDAVMKELQRRRESGERLAPEMEAMLDKVMEVKQRFPKDGLGSG